jgi:hypothetical protein
MRVEYKGYSIEAFERRPRNWFAKGRRLDGQKIKNPITKTEADCLETPSVKYSADDAIDFAKEIIDGLSRV